MSDGAHTLPGVITAITPQKKNKDRYSVFVDEAFLIGVDASTLLDYQLEKGQTITPALHRKLQREEGRNLVKSYLMKLLGRRDHARRELFTKARRKEYPADTINEVLDELEDKGYLNEAAFAASFARDKNHLNNWGPSKIKAHLLKKGVAKQNAERAVDEAFAETDLAERFRYLITKRQRRFRREEDAFKRKKKVFDYLHRKGYYSADIYRHLDDLMKLLAQ